MQPVRLAELSRWGLALLPATALAVAIASALGFGPAGVLLETLCHRLPERSFRWPDGTPFPICARCCGLYLGALIGLGLAAGERALATARIPSSWWLGLAATLVGIFDGLGHVLGFWDEPNLPRALSGASLGAGSFFLAGAVASSLALHVAHEAERGRTP